MVTISTISFLQSHWLLPAVIVAVLFAVGLILSLAHGGRHARNLRRAKTVYDKIQAMAPAQMMGYLRRIDPFVFEELVLLAFEKKGFRVRRNRRYTGDGGVDGAVWINGEKWLLQDKRYKKYISLKHVRDFEEVCRRRGCRGLFVHTGRTGAATRETIHNSDRLWIVSGDALVDLMRSEKNAATGRQGEQIPRSLQLPGIPSR